MVRWIGDSWAWVLIWRSNELWRNGVFAEWPDNPGLDSSIEQDFFIFMMRIIHVTPPD